MKVIPVIFLVFFMCGCTELYDFMVENDKPSLVIESQISNVSFSESKDYPSDGRYFTVRLRYTSNVAAVRDVGVESAEVNLIDDQGNNWYYTPSYSTPGLYTLFDDNFHAEKGVKYKLKVTLQNEEKYESSWEEMPEDYSAPIGNISFNETSVQKYVYQAGERVYKNIKGIDVVINLPKNNLDHPLYYIWKFKPTWTYRSPLNSIFDENYECWITSDYYLSDYAFQKDFVGSYKKSLFFVETEHNDRIFGEFTTLVTQYSVSEEYYSFWRDLVEQGERGGLFDPPPFNLKTNFVSSDPEKQVYGYFGVAEEQARRWWFSTWDLSYLVKNRWKDDCTQMRLVQPPKCNNCLLYMGGVSTNVKPSWWIN